MSCFDFMLYRDFFFLRVARVVLCCFAGVNILHQKAIFELLFFLSRQNVGFLGWGCSCAFHVPRAVVESLDVAAPCSVVAIIVCSFDFCRGFVSRASSAKHEPFLRSFAVLFSMTRYGLSFLPPEVFVKSTCVIHEDYDPGGSDRSAPFRFRGC